VLIGGLGYGVYHYGKDYVEDEPLKLTKYEKTGNGLTTYKSKIQGLITGKTQSFTAKDFCRFVANLPDQTDSGKKNVIEEFLKYFEPKFSGKTAKFKFSLPLEGFGNTYYINSNLETKIKAMYQLNVGSFRLKL